MCCFYSIVSQAQLAKIMERVVFCTHAHYIGTCCELIDLHDLTSAFMTGTAMVGHSLLAVKNLGGVIPVDISTIRTVEELKTMLLAKHPCDDPIERKILKAELLLDGSLLDDNLTLEAAGLLHESEVSVMYTRNEIEAARKDEILTKGFFHLHIPSGTTEISPGAFRYCRQVVSVTIPDSVIRIAESAFEGCSSLVSVTIPESVIEIDVCAFSGCNFLENIIIPQSVLYIGTRAFESCSSLVNIALPASMTQLADCTFVHCSSLKHVTLPKSITSIGVAAFEGCSSLVNINIPESVNSIAFSAFSGCTSLRHVLGCQALLHIGVGAFDGCASLATITLPKSVTLIGEPFAHCRQLVVTYV